MEKYMQPEPGNAIVKVPSSEWGDMPVQKTAHHSVTWGEIISLHSDDMPVKAYLIGRVGHWHRYSDDIMLNDEYAVVELKDIKATTKKETN
jgi:hypothetical protein